MCAFLPLLGVIAAFLPDIERRDGREARLTQQLRLARSRSTGSWSSAPTCCSTRSACRCRPCPRSIVAGALAAGGSIGARFALRGVGDRVRRAGLRLVSGRPGLRHPGAENPVPHFARARFLRQPDPIALRALGNQFAGHRQVHARPRHHRPAARGRPAHRLAAIHALEHRGRDALGGLRSRGRHAVQGADRHVADPSRPHRQRGRNRWSRGCSPATSPTSGGSARASTRRLRMARISVAELYELIQAGAAAHHRRCALAHRADARAALDTGRDSRSRG